MAETSPVVFFDACVLYPAALRSLLMYMAVDGLFQPRWSNAVHEEWMRALLGTRPDITRQQAERIRDLMNEHAGDSLVSGFEHRIGNLSLPDPADRHVLAAAIHCRASMIITFNLKHFPASALREFGIQPCSPDKFISDLLAAAPNLVCQAARRHRQSLKSPPLDVEIYLQRLEACRISNMVKALRNLSANL
ncbi:MAG: PIN domain-containing protein [Phycisphaerae bacterium]